MTTQPTTEETRMPTRCRCICPNGCDCGCTCPAATELRALARARREAGGGPIRIQRRRTKGYRTPPGSTYVGRPTRFGNPFHVVPVGGPLDMWAVTHQGRTLGRFDDKTAARADAIDRYARWIREPEQAEMRRLFRALLHGRDLTCWCPLGEPCHADVLLALVSAPVSA